MFTEQLKNITIIAEATAAYNWGAGSSTASFHLFLPISKSLLMLSFHFHSFLSVLDVLTCLLFSYCKYFSYSVSRFSLCAAYIDILIYTVCWWYIGVHIDQIRARQILWKLLCGPILDLLILCGQTCIGGLQQDGRAGAGVAKKTSHSCIRGVT